MVAGSDFTNFVSEHATELLIKTTTFGRRATVITPIKLSETFARKLATRHIHQTYYLGSSSGVIELRVEPK